MIKDMLLKTGRLIIRPYREEDLEECFQLMQDKELFRFLDMSVMALEEYSELFHWIIRCYSVSPDKDFKYSFNICLKETGKHIGWIGISGVEYDHSVKEMYWLIGREFQNNGYASEAAAALLEYGFTVMGLNEITAVCRPENIASEKVMKKISLKYQGVVEGLPEKHAWYNGELKYALTKEQFEHAIKQCN